MGSITPLSADPVTFKLGLRKQIITAQETLNQSKIILSMTARPTAGLGMESRAHTNNRTGGTGGHWYDLSPKRRQAQAAKELHGSARPLRTGHVKMWQHDGLL